MIRIQTYIKLVFLLIILLSVNRCASISRAMMAFSLPNDPEIIDTIQFITLRSDHSNSNVEKGIYVIQNHGYYASIWGMEGIDFDTEMVIAIFRGGCPSGGYYVSVEKILLTERSVLVFVKYQDPGRSCRTSSAITYPNTFIKMQKTDKYIDFIEEVVIKECR